MCTPGLGRPAGSFLTAVEKAMMGRELMALMARDLMDCDGMGSVET